MQSISFKLLRTRLFRVLMIFIFGLFVFFVFRLVFIFRFGSSEVISLYAVDLFVAIVTGFRFDMVVLAYPILFVVVLSACYLINNQRLHRLLNSISIVYITSFLTLFSLILIADQQYYAFFQTHINILAFGIIEDDTRAVLTSVWTDHPVIRVLLAMILIGTFIYFVSRFIVLNQKLNIAKTKAFFIAFPIAFLCFYAYAIRGSFGTFPVQIDDSTVSENPFINTVAMNGVFSLNLAISEKDNQLKRKTEKAILAELGYENVEEALSDFFGKPVETFDTSNYKQYLFRTTTKNDSLAHNPPHVVVCIMESMSNHLIDYHSDSLNLLGAFEKHFYSGITFRNFVSGTNGTIGTLETLLLNTPYWPLTATEHRYKSFETSIAYPYKLAGYQTVFITGGKLGWRSLNEFIPRQFFDVAEGKTAILKNVPNARENSTWGVYDQYLFDYVLQKLQQADKPQFIVILSTTNHTPFQLPPEYEPFSVVLPDSLLRQATPERDIVKKSLTAFQYSNNCIGIFLDKLAASEIGKKTIVAVTGDHNSWSLFSYDNTSNLLRKYSVPLHLYIPEEYIPDIQINTNIYGSHKDILPTLYNLSLSEVEFFGLGNNLFDKTMQFNDFYGINTDYNAIPPDADKDLKNKKIKAYYTLLKLYFNEKF